MQKEEVFMMAKEPGNRAWDPSLPKHLPLEHFLIKSRSKAICHGRLAYAHISDI
jgi:hypothetical protein